MRSGSGIATSSGERKRHSVGAVVVGKGRRRIPAGMRVAPQRPKSIRAEKSVSKAESDALDFHAVAIAELKGAGAGWRVDGEEFAPDAVHLVVILDIREDDVDLHNPVQSGAGGCQHMFHVSQSLANLIGDRPEVAPAGSGVDRPHSRKEDVLADANARRVRQVG